MRQEKTKQHRTLRHWASPLFVFLVTTITATTVLAGGVTIGTQDSDTGVQDREADPDLYTFEEYEEKVGEPFPDEDVRNDPDGPYAVDPPDGGGDGDPGGFDDGGALQGDGFDADQARQDAEQGVTIGDDGSADFGGDTGGGTGTGDDGGSDDGAAQACAADMPSGYDQGFVDQMAGGDADVGANVAFCLLFGGPSMVLSGCTGCFEAVEKNCSFSISSSGIRASGSNGATSSACLPFAPFFL